MTLTGTDSPTFHASTSNDNDGASTSNDNQSDTSGTLLLIDTCIFVAINNKFTGKLLITPTKGRFNRFADVTELDVWGLSRADELKSVCAHTRQRSRNGVSYSRF